MMSLSDRVMQLLATSLTTVLISACATAQTAEPANLQGPGYVIGLIRSGEPPEFDMHGAADMENDRPISEATVFHIASLSKQITAAALAMAILEDRVSLDDPVSAYIPEAEKYGAELKIAHLLYMTSGLTEYTSVPRGGGHALDNLSLFHGGRGITACLGVEALQFEPGTQWSYSNVNYMLITRILAGSMNNPSPNSFRRRSSCRSA